MVSTFYVQRPDAHVIETKRDEQPRIHLFPVRKHSNGSNVSYQALPSLLNWSRFVSTRTQLKNVRQCEQVYVWKAHTHFQAHVWLARELGPNHISRFFSWCNTLKKQAKHRHIIDFCTLRTYRWLLSCHTARRAGCQLTRRNREWCAKLAPLQWKRPRTCRSREPRAPCA